MNRIRTTTLAIALSFAGISALAQAKDQLYTATHQQLDVSKVLIAQQRAWNTGDLDGYVAYYKDAPDTAAILATPVRGLHDIRAAFHTNFPTAEAMGTLEQTEVEVRPLGDNYALATGKYHLTRAKKHGGDIEGTFTEIFEKTTAGWQVIYSETT